MIYRAIMLVLVILITGFSCQKALFPNATQKGANAMAVNMNGKLWQPKPCFSCVAGGSALDAIYNKNGKFSLTAENFDFEYNVITINIKKLKSRGQFVLGEGKGGDTPNNYAVVYTTADNYYTTAKSGKVNITKLDTTSKIISGTFEFVVVNQRNPNDQLTIQRGWFDMKYK